MIRRKKYRYKRKVKKYYNFNIKLFSFILVILALFISAGYYIFFRKLTINCGIVVDKHETKNYLELKLAYDGKTQRVKVKKSTKLIDSIAYNVTLKGLYVDKIEPCKIYTGEVQFKEGNSVVLSNNSLTLSERVRYYNFANNKLTPVSNKVVLVGYSNCRFIADKSNKISVILADIPDIKKLRVGISNSDFTSLNHSQLIMASKKGLSFQFDNNLHEIRRGDALKLTYNNGIIHLFIVNDDNKTFPVKASIGTTKNKILIYSNSDVPIKIKSLKRSNTHVPEYFGSLKVFIKDKSMRLVNDVDIEDYLKYVVPSEIPSSAGFEGYKSQAIAARTYALSDLISGRFSNEGFNLDDSNKSQVYNERYPVEESEQNKLISAISETSGKILSYNKKLIDAKYYSTSCGLSAPFNQVWYSSNTSKISNPEPYLDYVDLTETGIKDLSSEDIASTFLKDWTTRAFDSNSQYFRWKVELDYQTLEKTINSNIYLRYTKSPDSFKKKWLFNIYKKTTIPKEGIGKIRDIEISKRGRAGNVMEMLITTDDAVYKIEKDINIKRLLAPKNFELNFLYGKPQYVSTFPSSFFVLEKEYKKNSLKTVTIYGGGYGHGVGMSQTAVIGMVRKGYNHEKF
ncbi:hypothetical protein Q428_07450 [Fervidicella metallireducens AeB]|uniref:Sporulation stage II protein D amidase enhancer LytB N-terminal domain-containing protein n=1 Tax=Fervidicella metallireducens AeB TaxID=1403537 RepID=A0A017RVU0_9CLOT|nr:SpoIID/LytB domain-containing protein [Fervidicella metallireducens]EYE88504.1 hypothetical protein Q428_07450 [Fervidicella metallireducens AeB]